MATPNMNLDLPTPHVTSGTWGDTLNADLTLVDEHDHTTGKGVALPYAAMPSGVASYDIMFSYPGVPTADKVMGRIVCVRRFVIGFNAAASRGSVGVLPTAPATILVKLDGITVYTITVSALGVFTFVGGTTTCDPGNVLTLVAQNVPDLTMADISITLAGVLA